MTYVTSIERLAIEEGMEKGLRQGMEKGMQQGMQQGRREGKVQLLERLLAVRFGQLPDWVCQRVEHANENTLDDWTEALLSSDSLESVFGMDAH